MAVEAPTLPYARDEASTSQHIAPYPHTIHEYDNPLSPSSGEEEDSIPDQSPTSLQYWAAKRHRSSLKGKGKADDEHGTLCQKEKSHGSS
jgi:regulator-associated protein of mTOR